MTNEEWTAYAKEVDLNADGKLTKMELFFAIKTYFSKKLVVETEFDYPDFDDIGKNPGYPEASSLDSKLKGVVDKTYPQFDKNKNGSVANREVAGFINTCLTKIGVPLTVS